MTVATRILQIRAAENHLVELQVLIVNAKARHASAKHVAYLYGELEKTRQELKELEGKSD